ncbi:alpha-amylase family glycosyl hydrolase [soil metagenome]
MTMMRSITAGLFALLLAGAAQAQTQAPTSAPLTDATADPIYTPRPVVTLTHPDWTKNAVLYQLNTRQFTPEGTFRAAQAELPRLKALGVDVIWLMPIHPIGEINRKGTLGSPYSIKDYYGVNPEFGTLDDLKAFVAAAHAQGMKVILDWVANHTAWDNVLTTTHPEWYQRDLDGHFRPTPWWDWSDIINLDYHHAGLRQYMTEALVYWVREADIDGYRADVAGFVPLDFWETARKQMEAVKPVFMLAEWEMRDMHHAAFDASYAWSWKEAMMKVADGDADTNALATFYSWHESAYPREAMRMTYTSNHDQNAWEGTEYEEYGPAREAAIVLSVVGEGIPLIYNGQEVGNRRRLAFFEKDPIVWPAGHALDEQGLLYQRLFALKHANPALWNGQWGGLMHKVVNSAPTRVLSFFREKDGNQVFAVLNLSGEPQTVTFEGTHHLGDYVDLDGAAATFAAGSTIELPAWGWRVYVRPA